MFPFGHLLEIQEVLNNSDHHPILFLSNLVEGTYTFHLKVTDAKGESNEDRATVEVKPGECVHFRHHIFFPKMIGFYMKLMWKGESDVDTVLMILLLCANNK